VDHNLSRKVVKSTSRSDVSKDWKMKTEVVHGLIEGRQILCLLESSSAARCGANFADVQCQKHHWLDVPDRVFFKPSVTVHRCLNGRAPLYLSDYCVPAAGADTRRQLRSINRQLLAVPRYRLNTYGCRAFSVAGPRHSLELCHGFYPGHDRQYRLFQTPA